MGTIPPPTPAPNPSPGQTVFPQNKLAPVWHTAALVILLLGNSFLGFFYKPSVSGTHGPVLLYSATFLFELFLFLLIWFWIRRSGVSMRELIGGRWNTPEDFLLDRGLAVGFFFAASFVILIVRIAMGTINLHHIDQLTQETKRTFGPMIPRSGFQLGLFVLLSVSAGLFEEIIFRGYLQRQMGALARNSSAGIIGSGVIFGAAHGYQGGRMMIALGIYGVLFGVLAHLRKSLRPGMMAHAIQDAYSGISLFFLLR